MRASRGLFLFLFLGTDSGWRESRIPGFLVSLVSFLGIAIVHGELLGARADLRGHNYQNDSQPGSQATGRSSSLSEPANDAYVGQNFCFFAKCFKCPFWE